MNLINTKPLFVKLNHTSPERMENCMKETFRNETIREIE
jgi:hypothetical protein